MAGVGTGGLLSLGLILRARGAQFLGCSPEPQAWQEYFAAKHAPVESISLARFEQGDTQRCAALRAGWHDADTSLVVSLAELGEPRLGRPLVSDWRSDIPFSFYSMEAVL
jgi:hypothetical protein